MAIKKTFGTCDVVRFLPAIENIDNSTQVINSHITYGEALKLHHSLGKALDKISTYKMSSIEGKCATVNLAVHLNGKSKERISILEGKTPKAQLK